MYKQYPLFTRWNLLAHLPEAKGMEDIVTNKNEVNQTITYPLKNAGIGYTIEGRLPNTGRDTIYKPFPLVMKIPLTDTVYETTYTKWGVGYQRVIQTAILRHVNVNPVTPKKLEKGLNYTIYKTMVYDYNKLDTVKSVDKGVLTASSAIRPFRGYSNTWMKLNGYLKIDKEGDYNITQGFEVSPVIYLDKDIIIYRDQNKYVDPQRAFLHLQKGVYQLKGYYIANNENVAQLPIVMKDADGKTLDVSEYLFH